MTSAPRSRLSDESAGPSRLRYATWTWLTVCVGTATVGMRAIYRNTSIVRIDEFSRLYDRLGLTDATMITALLVVPLSLAIAAAALIAIRKPHDGPAQVMAMCLVAIYFFTSGASHGVEPAWLRHGSASVAVVLIVVFLAVFPSGTFVPRWSIVAPLAATVVLLARPTLAVETRALVSGVTERNTADSLLAWTAWSLLLVLTGAAQIWRHRTMSTRDERQKSRWVILGSFGLLLPPVAVLVLNAAGLSNAGLVGGLVLASVVGSFLLPAAVLIAVFRYHLYDLDAVISRTVSYTLVAGVVASAYTVPVLVLGRILGGSNDLVIAGSTMIAAAAFNPARRGIQRLVDRRFDRARYDAELETATIARRLAGQVDLRTVTEQVVELVDRTIAPNSVSVWLREER